MPSCAARDRGRQSRVRATSRRPDNEPPETRSVPTDGGESSVTRDLARGAAQGDDQDLARLVERLAPALYAWARLRAHPSLRSEPEDVVGEVWLRVVRGVHRYDAARGPFRPWLFQVAKHVLLDALRRARAGPREVLEDASRAAHLSQVPDRVSAISSRLAREDGLRAFLERAARLKELDRDLLVHCGLEGMAVSRAAELLGIAPSAAERRWQRLRARLREGLLPLDLLAG